MSVGLGDISKKLSRPDQWVKSKNGRLTMTFANANYDEVDTKTTVTENQASNIESKANVVLQADMGAINIVGSNLAADTDSKNGGTVGLSAATGVNILEASDTFEKQTKEIHGSAELSIVVQHQAVELVMAAKGVLDARSKLSDAKHQYNDYQRNLEQLKEQLTQMESDVANHVPGVNKDDLVELRELVQSAKDDEEFYQGGIALASVNLATAITSLVQQTIAATASSATWGFNAGVQLDIDATRSNTAESSTTAKGSSVTGNQIIIQTGIKDANGKLNTTGTQTTIEGSQLIAQQSTADDDSIIKSGIAINTGDLNILNSRDTYENKNTTEHGHLTAEITVYGAAGGVSISGSLDRSQSSTRSSTVNNSVLNADNISLITSNDLNIAGATVRANDDLNVDVGGNLNLESQQNRSNSKNSSFGVSGGVSLGESGNVSGVNAGISVGNGMSYTRETVLTSLTSGGTADVNVKGHTQITGALLGTTDDDGNDLGKLNFSTGSLDFMDLRNTNVGSQMSLGVSANFSVGSKPNATEATSPTNTAKSTSGTDLKLNSSNINFSNSEENSASKSMATLGHGNITVGGVQLEKDGQLTDAGNVEGSALFGLSRDTSNTDKSLWSSNESQHVDANIDNRFFTTEGRKEIATDFGKAAELSSDIGNAIKRVAKDKEATVFNLFSIADKNIKATQVKNDLRETKEGQAVLEALKGEGDNFASAFETFSVTAQQKYGFSPDDIKAILLYDSNKTTSSSLQDTVALDTKGGTVNDTTSRLNGQSFVDANNGGDKYDLIKTAGHEIIEREYQLKGTEKNDTSEYMADVFGERLAYRINQALDGSLVTTSGYEFESSLLNSNHVYNNTLLSNSVGNANVDYRQMTRSEQSRLHDLAKGDVNKEARLAIASCALTHCYAEYPVGSESYNRYKALADKGSSDEYTVERAELNDQWIRVGRGTQQVQLYQYGTVDSVGDAASRANNTYQITTRVSGGVQGIGGAIGAGAAYTSAGGSAAACPVTGLSCVAAVGLGMAGTASLDFSLAGFNTMVSGRHTSTAFTPLISNTLGISPQAAELLEGGIALIPGAVDAYAINQSLNAQKTYNALVSASYEADSAAVNKLLLSDASLVSQERQIIKIDISEVTKGSQEYELLNDPMRRGPDTVYELSNGTTFRTNDAGFVEEISFTPSNQKMSRDSRQTAIGNLGKDTDVGGHVQACSQGGTCDEFNLFPQDQNFNNSAYKVYYENVVKKAMNDPNNVVGETTVKFTRSNPKSPRPDELELTYRINGEETTVKFENKANQTPEVKK